jgi:hypothetical protein
MIFRDTQLSNDLKNCDNLPSKWSYWCSEKAKEQWMKRLDWMKNSVYPWNNKDWDYKQFVKNRYDPEDVLKLKKGGSISELINNIDIIIKQIESILTAPNPDANSVAGITDQPSSNNKNKDRFLDLKRQISILSHEPTKNRNELEGLYAALNDMISSKLITSKEYGLGLTQDGVYQKPPYDDHFFNKPITGEYSSSYFIQTGFCKSTETNQSDCNNKKFRWIGDVCYKPKYIYINNSPGLKIGRVKGMKGLVPSIINDVSQLNPDSIYGIMNGYSVPGVDIQQCPNEYFDNYNLSVEPKKLQNINKNSNKILNQNKNINKESILHNKNDNKHKLNYKTNIKLDKKDNKYRHSILLYNFNQQYKNLNPVGILNYSQEKINLFIILLLIFALIALFYTYKL